MEYTHNPYIMQVFEYNINVGYRSLEREKKGLFISNKQKKKI